MASTVHEPSSQCSSITCVYYPKICFIWQQSPGRFLRPSAAIYEMFFPGSCSQCSTLRIPMDGLCLFCHHLRLQHLFYCLRDQDPEVDPWLDLGRLADLQLRLGCTFCTFILRMVQKQSQTLRVNIYDSESIIISLRVFGRPSKANFATSPVFFSDADVYVCSDSEHTSIHSFTADETWYFPHKLHVPIRIRQRESPDEPNMMGEIVNWQRLRTWIKDCMDHHIHDDPIHPLRENVFGSLLFINVEKGFIVSAPSSCNYIALGYVWGDHTAGMTQTTKQSIDHFRKPGSLMGHRIPATIRDAMMICHQLGVLYLWVDRFCIVQDDELQKHEQIRSMGMIYSGALLTICAAAGNNADYGLPGVQSRPRGQVRPRTFAFGVEVVTGRKNDESTWNSRGWTYQEMILSRRRLIFTDEDVFLECNQVASAEVSTPMEPSSRLVALDGFDTKLESYTNHVENYTRRNLSYITDVYNAFVGICGSIFPSKDLIYGLPTSAFDEAILWETFFAQHDDRWPRHNLGNGLCVPSWSWASEFGNEVVYTGALSAFGSFAKWSFVEQQDQVRSIQSVDTPSGWYPSLNGSCYDPRLYLALSWREHVIESAPSFTICWDLPFVEIESHVIEEWPTYRDYWKQAHGRSRIETKVGTELVGRLLLRTSVALFRLVHCRDSLHNKCVVYSDDGFPCGWVNLSSIAIEKELPEMVESFPMFGRRKVQLVALSCTHFDEFDVRTLFEAHCLLPIEKKSESSSVLQSRFDAMKNKMENLSSYHADYIGPETTYYDSTNSPLDPPPGIRVMMISWRGDVAYRVGLGVVLLRQWKKGNPTFRTIVLK